MDRELEATFIEALDALEAGKSPEEILARYPQQAEALRPMLETAAELSNVPVAYSAAARKESRDAFLQRASDLRGRRRPAATVAPWWRRFALAFGSLGVLLLIVGGLLVGPAGDSLPGDALYPLKVVGEEARLALAGGPAQRDALREQFRQERVSEINALLALEREAEVSCFGTLQAVEEDAWLLEDLPVTITAGTEIEGEPRVGAEAEGTCRVADGQVTAVSMRVQSVPNVLPQPTATLTPAPTVTPTTTVAPAVTETPTPTDTPAVTATATPEPTQSLTPTPPPEMTTVAPPAGEPTDDGDDDASDDDDDDGGDDDDGDDDDDDGDGDDDGEGDDGSDDDDDGDDDDDDGGDDDD